MLSLGIGRGEKLIVAVSGGADSVALLAALSASGYECLAAHCNFHLRGAESMRDMHFVEQLAADLDLDLAIKDFDVPGRMKATGESLEMACRELRYEWFHNLLEREHAAAIAVGHHREDNVETFLLKLLRGSGLNGLCGIRPRNGFIVRPMLDLTRTQILAYLEGRGLGHIEDSSNAQNDFGRNKLRNILLPQLESLFPGASEAILSSVAKLSSAASVYNRSAAETMGRYIDPDGSLRLRDLSEEVGDDAQTILYEFLRGYGMNYVQAGDALRASASSGKTVSSSTHRLEIDRGVGRLFDLRQNSRTSLDPKSVEVSLARDILLPVNIEVEMHDIAEFRPRRDSDTMYLDIKALEGEPKWEIRPVRDGDRMHPFGMKGTKLLSDIMTGAKFTAEQKRRTLLLTRNGHIIWAIGLRASNLFPVTPKTRRYISLHLVSPRPLDPR